MLANLNVILRQNVDEELHIRDSDRPQVTSMCIHREGGGGSFLHPGKGSTERGDYGRTARGPTAGAGAQGQVLAREGGAGVRERRASRASTCRFVLLKLTTFIRCLDTHLTTGGTAGRRRVGLP